VRLSFVGTATTPRNSHVFLQRTLATTDLQHTGAFSMCKPRDVLPSDGGLPWQREGPRQFLCRAVRCFAGTGPDQGRVDHTVRGRACAFCAGGAGIGVLRCREFRSHFYWVFCRNRLQLLDASHCICRYDKDFNCKHFIMQATWKEAV